MANKMKVFAVYKLGRTGKRINLGGAVAFNKENALKQVRRVWGSNKIQIGKELKPGYKTVE